MDFCLGSETLLYRLYPTTFEVISRGKKKKKTPEKVYNVTLFRNPVSQTAYELALGPLLRPKPATTLTNLLLYCMRLLARPVFCFFFSCFST